MGFADQQLQFFDMDNEMEPPGEDGVFSERVQYMFHAPSIAAGHQDPYADGGGSALPARRPRRARGGARRCCRTRTAGRTTPNAPHRASVRPAASAGWGTFP